MPEYSEEEYLAHYGILRKSGRYPWGSGGPEGSAGESQRSRDFFGMVQDLERQGLSKTQIAEGFGMTTTQLRDATTLANNAIRREKQEKAQRLRDKGWGASAIGREMGLTESSVRALLDPAAQERARVLNNTIEMLRSEVDKGGYLDIGKGQEFYVGNGLSKEKLRSAVAALKDEGYEQIDVQVAQAGSGNQKTTVKTLCPPGTTYKDVVTNLEAIKSFTKVSDDGGRTNFGILPPLAVDPKRVGITYKEDGGATMDGVVYVRPGVKDLSMGGSTYAQVRIDVGGSHYIKGMAVYKDDLPPGVDLMVNTNKSRGTPKMGDKNNTVLKNQTDDPDNPFGAVIKAGGQVTERGADGTRRVTSAINRLQDEGDWDKWSRGLSSQVVSKQSPKLAQQQLGKTLEKRQQELNEILALTNPTVREKLLDSFSSAADSDAVHLSAAGLPRSSYHVILPFNGLKDNEVYAPNFKNGERVVLIRYPHGGKFEIPELVVNNNHPPAIKQVGRARDAVGINSKVAERLSGADFDGDFVMVIPNDRGDIKTTPPLKKLEGFDPQTYKLPDDAPRMSARTKGIQMGDVSNLITDMTIKGATNDEIARAVRHSMVVIDAEKHHLDYKKSAVDNGISALKVKYQGGANRGASTLISRATSTAYVGERRLARTDKGGPIDKATGKFVYEYSGAKNYKGDLKTIKSTKLGEAEDAHSLSSGTVMEKVYADHSNRLKALANGARKEMVNNTDAIPLSPSAKKVYKDDVDQLKADLKVAEMNAPRERTARLLADAIIKQKKQANPDMDPATLKKVQAQALAEARTRAGAKKDLVPISDRQWEAIQAGAVSKSMLKRILDNADIERVKELATPRAQLKMDAGTTARAKALAARGLTQAEIARVLGVSLTTLKTGLTEGAG